jgi:hypothetical protein
MPEHAPSGPQSHQGFERPQSAGAARSGWAEPGGEEARPAARALAEPMSDPSELEPQVEPAPPPTRLLHAMFIERG